MTRILVIDNYDSFVYNLVQYLAQIGAEVDVWRNDDPRFAEPGWQEGYDGILLSPGPGAPEDAGVCIEVARSMAGVLPVFGVCLGLQAICVAFGGRVDRADELRHGKTSPIGHDGAGVFAGLANPFTATRYHSLVAVEVPDELVVTSWVVDADGAREDLVMGVRHRELPIEAVQFHPESVLTEGGYQMLANWLVACGDAAAPERAAGLSPLMSAQ
ncbi:anthranilate synthase component II [Enemella sp. A6]|uniref:anthranilate synthase component II n=1 Tax=Enemella sp. A6 TaxID=3440152 RepID=UPI003EBFD1E1